MEVYTIKEAMQILRVSRMTLMKLLEAKKLRSVRVGARWLIPTDAMKDFLQGA